MSYELLLEELTRSGNYYTISKLHIQFFGQDFIKAGVWSELTELSRISRFRKDSEWFQFNYEFLSKKIGISLYKTKECIQNLIELNYLQKKYEGLPSKIQYKMNYQQFWFDLQAFLSPSNSPTKFTKVESEVRTNCENDLLNIIKDQKNIDSKESIEAPEKTSGASVKLVKRKVVEENTDKPTLVKRIPSIFPNDSVKNLFRYWNSLGKPLTIHSEKPETKIFQSSITLLAKALKHYTEEDIQKSLFLYHRLLNYPNSTLNLRAPGHLVSLSEFFKFTEETNKRIAVSTANQTEDPLQGVDCWFEECIKGWDYLLSKFEKVSKCIPDNNPEVTKELAKCYRDNINKNPLRPNDINIIIRASQKLVDYHKNMKDKLNFNSCPLEKDSPRLFAHHMIDAILFNLADKSIVTVNWLVTDTHFNVRMNNHFKRLGMLDSDHIGSIVDTMNDSTKQKQEQEYKELHLWKQTELKKIEDAQLPHDQDLELRLKLMQTMKEKQKEIFEKYGGDRRKAKREEEDFDLHN